MIAPGSNRYEVVLQDRFFLGDLVEKITLEESLDEIAYRAAISLVASPDLPGLAPGQEIRISGTPFGSGEMSYLLHPGVVWDWTSRDGGQRHIDITVYDRTIYLSKSEDEYLMPKGQTADQRLRHYAQDWNIPVADTLESTGIQLERNLYRPQTIYSMIMADLKETAVHGGEMYRPRMTPAGLELARLGGNKPVWMLELAANVQEVVQRQTLEGAVTQVKMLSSERKNKIPEEAGAPSEQSERLNGSEADTRELPSPVLAVEKGETALYGTLQKIVQDSQGDVVKAKAAARQMLSGIQETFSVTAIDINTIRAGDKVELAGSGLDLLVTSVRHELGSPGRMSLELAIPDYVRRRYYGSV